MKRRNYILFLIVTVLASACAPRASKDMQKGIEPSVITSSHRLEFPTPPVMLTSDSARIDYIASHYWDSFDFTDTTWITDTMAMEQTFAGWAGILTQIPTENATNLAIELIGKAAVCPMMLLRLTELSEYCFRHPNSPMRNEDIFISVLKKMITVPQIDSLYKVRYEFLLTLALKNRPCMITADFTYTTGMGNKGKLSNIRGEYTLLMFYNPDCHECARVEKFIEQSVIFASLTNSKRLAVVAIYPDADLTAWRNHLSQMPDGWIVGCDHAQEITEKELYDLAAIPTLYLLDNKKRVILKDASVESIEEWLKNKS